MREMSADQRTRVLAAVERTLSTKRIGPLVEKTGPVVAWVTAAVTDLDLEWRVEALEHAVAGTRGLSSDNDPGRLVSAAREVYELFHGPLNE